MMGAHKYRKDEKMLPPVLLREPFFDGGRAGGGAVEEALRHG